MDCKQCKRTLVETLGFVLFKNATHHLEKDQKLVLAGCFSGANEDDSQVMQYHKSRSNTGAMHLNPICEFGGMPQHRSISRSSSIALTQMFTILEQL